MSISRARTMLAFVWFALAGAAALLVFRMHSIDWIGKESLDQLLAQLNRSYAPYLGATLGYYFAAPNVAKISRKKIQQTAFALAIFTALFWNGCNLYFLLMLRAGKLSVDDGCAGIDKFSSGLAWLVAPAMGFFFAAHVGSEQGEHRG